MKRFQRLLAAVAISGMASIVACSPQQSGTGSTSQNVPYVSSGGRMVGRLTGDATRAQYSDDYTGNIVGGGDNISQRLSGDATRADYVNPHTRSSPGIPTFSGGGEGDIIYLPHPN